MEISVHTKALLQRTKTSDLQCLFDLYYIESSDCNAIQELVERIEYEGEVHTSSCVRVFLFQCYGANISTDYSFLIWVIATEFLDIKFHRNCRPKWDLSDQYKLLLLDGQNYDYVFWKDVEKKILKDVFPNEDVSDINVHQEKIYHALIESGAICRVDANNGFRLCCVGIFIALLRLKEQRKSLYENEKKTDKLEQHQVDIPT